MSIHTPGVLAIARERQRQITEEGWSPAHDAHYTAGELELAASCYAEFAAMQRCSPECAAAAQVPPHWPFDATWWKPGSPTRNLERAGALIAAALDQHYSAQEKLYRKHRYQLSMWADMEPDVYGGDTCNEHVPRWHIHSEGDQDSEYLHGPVMLDPRQFPAGTKIRLSVPRCPQCDLPADMNGVGNPCECGYDWRAWTEARYS